MHDKWYNNQMSTHLVNIVIDVQDHRERPPGAPPSTLEDMDETVRAAYLKSVRDTVEEFRQRGIPTIFVAIGDSSQLYPAGEQRDLAKLSLTSVAPRPDEDIFLKRFMDTFTDIKDVRASTELAAYIGNQRPDNKLENGNIKGAHFGETTFLDHLKALGVEQVTIMGTMAEFCITDNALGAAMNGIKATILTDKVAGWKDHTYTKPVWHEGAPELHEKSISDTLDKVKADPVFRGFKEADAGKVSKVIDSISMRTTNDFFMEHDGPKVVGSKFSHGGAKTDGDYYGRTQPETIKPAEPSAPAIAASKNRNTATPKLG